MVRHLKKQPTLISGILPQFENDESKSETIYPVHNGCLQILAKSSAAFILTTEVDDGLGITESGDKAVVNAGEFCTIGWKGDMVGMGLSWGNIMPLVGEKTGWLKSEWGEASRAELVTSPGEGRRVMKFSSSSSLLIINTESTSNSSLCEKGSDREAG